MWITGSGAVMWHLIYDLSEIAERLVVIDCVCFTGKRISGGKVCQRLFSVHICLSVDQVVSSYIVGTFYAFLLRIHL